MLVFFMLLVFMFLCQLGNILVFERSYKQYNVKTLITKVLIFFN